MEQSTKHVNNAKGDSTVTAIKQSKKKGDDSHKGTKKTNASREGVQRKQTRRGKACGNKTRGSSLEDSNSRTKQRSQIANKDEHHAQLID